MNFTDIMNHAPQNRKNFEDLAKYCKSGHIVPFIGAGLSDFANKIDEFNDKFLTWWNYLSVHYENCYKKNWQKTQTYTK
ncbi:MAG: hypothetical protein LBO74_17810 [Candidatus Symbiothrix sp.]|jgi:hypothetical protein|nr:hypothetical protein [Candidatus Symbiothrix sp.]